mgnify:CR=1 FL=1
MEDKIKSLFNKCLRLFFFFQKRESYETMMMHDYGFYQFEKYENYLDYKMEKESLDPDKVTKEDEKYKNTPLFET